MSELISVIIPVYNVERYIAATLDSVIVQTYSNLEIIVIDDGSTDHSLGIVKNYEKKDSRFKVISKKNEGLSVARELGIESAQGTFFVTIDSDDLIDPEYIKKLYKTITESNADIALCARKTFGADKDEILLLDENIDQCLQVDNDLLEQKYNYIAGTYQMSDSWNKMYRKSFVKEADVHFILPRQYNGTDLLFNYSLLLHRPKISIINEPLYFYRLTENSRVRRKNKHLEIGFRYIADRLLEENRRCTGSEKIENQIYAAYLSMLKYASQDLAQEIDGLKSKDKILQQYKDFLKAVPYIERTRRSDIFHASRPELRVFVSLLFMRSARGIFCYYKLRELWRK